MKFFIKQNFNIIKMYLIYILLINRKLILYVLKIYLDVN